MFAALIIETCIQPIFTTMNTNNNVKLTVISCWTETRIPSMMPYGKSLRTIQWTDLGIWQFGIIKDVAYYVTNTVDLDGKHLVIQCYIPYYGDGYWFPIEDLDKFAIVNAWRNNLE